MSNLYLKASNNLSFGVTIYPDGYSKMYKKGSPNGKEPDKFLLKVLDFHYPNPQGVDVLDLGAGDGRNAIPIAQRGYSVTANEFCPEANEKMYTLKSKLGLNKLTIKAQNILKRIKQKVKQFDFAFMSHITQHFSPADLRLSMINLNQQVKDKGIVVFDALVRKQGYENLNSTQQDEIYGNAHFRLEDIIRIVTFSGFKILGIFSFNNDSKEDANYLHCAMWGKAEKELNRPIELKWFVLQKDH